jgi:Zn-dependent protease with chaperone function
LTYPNSYYTDIAEAPGVTTTTDSNREEASMTAKMSNTTTALVLYAITLAGQSFSAVARSFIVYLTLEIIRLLTGWPIPSNPIALAVAFIPLAVSLLALLLPPLVAPVEGHWWEISSGGRPPEQDEHDAYEHAIEQLREIDPELRAPKHWFVAEEPGTNAAAYASTMCVDRGLLESPFAAAVIAHELGHLNSSDARLASALNLLLIAPMPTPALRPLWSLPFRALAWLATGQAMLWLTGNAWDAYWRNREFAADQYAAYLGQGLALAMSLEHGSLPYERSIRRMRFSRATHPYTKPRIAKLRAQPDRPAGDQQ